MTWTFSTHQPTFNDSVVKVKMADGSWATLQGGLNLRVTGRGTEVRLDDGSWVEVARP